MKRIGNIYHRVCSMENLRVAESKARKGKTWQPGVKLFDRNPDHHLFMLHEMLLNKHYRTSEYKVFKVFEAKEREVYRLPYFPDRITHHAIMNVLEPVFYSTYTADTYSCIKKRGINGASFNLRDVLTDEPSTRYCLKIDIQKFYPNVDHSILKGLLRRKIKDADILWLLDEIIDSAPGLPIGNYLSQTFGNFYLTYLDHFIKEQLRVKHYFRYCDDLVFLADNKPHLHDVFHAVQRYLNDNLKLTVKNNRRLFPVRAGGIDFVGYVHYHDHVRMRKSIKKNMAKAVAKNLPRINVAPYFGWAKYSNSKNLLKKLSMTAFSDLKIKAPTPAMEGNKIEMFKVLNKEIKVLAYEVKTSKFLDKGNGKCLYLQIEVNGEKRILFSGSGVLMDTIQLVPKDKFPFTTTIVKENERFQFT